MYHTIRGLTEFEDLSSARFGTILDVNWQVIGGDAKLDFVLFALFVLIAVCKKTIDFRHIAHILIAWRLRLMSESIHFGEFGIDSQMNSVDIPVRIPNSSRAIGLMRSALGPSESRVLRQSSMLLFNKNCLRSRVFTRS